MSITLNRYNRQEAVANAGSNDLTTLTIVDDGQDGVDRCVKYACEKFQCIPEDADKAFFGWPSSLELSDFKLEVDNGTSKSSKFIQKIEGFLVVAWAFKSKRHSKSWPEGQTLFSLAAMLEAKKERLASSQEAGAQAGY